MNSKGISRKDIEEIKKYFIDIFEFDLMDSKNKGNPFYDNYQLLLTLNTKSQQFNFIFFNSLYGAIEYMESIKEINTKIYRHYRTRLTKSINNLGFYGDLFELYIAWTLTKKEVVFKNPKHPKPDFEISYKQDKLFIECTSVQFDSNTIPTKKGSLLKIKKALGIKMGKEYVNSSTALMMDITNLCYHCEIIENPLTLEEVRQITTETTKERIDSFIPLNTDENVANYGLIIFVYFSTTKTNNGEIGWALNFFDIRQNIHVNDILIKFMDANLINIEMTSLKLSKFNH
jgi:hypothetical protein